MIRSHKLLTEVVHDRMWSIMIRTYRVITNYQKWPQIRKIGRK